MPQPNDTARLWSPLFRSGSEDWKRDRDLIEGVAATVDQPDGPYDRASPGVCHFREWVSRCRKSGYDRLPEARDLAAWLRECMATNENREGKGEMPAHTIHFPDDFEATLAEFSRRRAEILAETPSLELRFSDETNGAFALDRADALYDGDFGAYLENLVEKERLALRSPLGSFYDLLHACETAVARRGFQVDKSFSAHRTDLWVPELGLGIETVSDWEGSKEYELIRVLSDTNSRWQADSLVVVTPDAMPRTIFQAIRKVKEPGVFQNLSVLRMAEFCAFLDDLAQARTGEGDD